MKNGVFQVGERAVAKLAAGHPIVKVVDFDVNLNKHKVEFADGSTYWYNVWDLDPLSSQPHLAAVLARTAPPAPDIHIGDLVLVPWALGEYLGRVIRQHPVVSDHFYAESLTGTVVSKVFIDELRLVTDSWVNDPREIGDIRVGDEVEYLGLDPRPTGVIVESRIFDDEYLVLFPDGKSSIWCASDELGLVSRNGARLLFAPAEQTCTKSMMDGPFPTLREFLVD